MTARPIRRNAQTPDRNGKIFYTSITSLSHISKVSGHEAADGWRRRGTDRHDSGAAAFWTFWLNYGILKLKEIRIRYNPKKPMKINRNCGL